MLGLVDQQWGFASHVLTEIFAADADAGFRAVFSRYQRASTSAAFAQGWSNRQIADELVITERSAESHVERIRARLGFRSRAQIAAWYVATNPSMPG